MAGKLYICGTPIGNLDDITLRTLKTLEGVDLIAAEDTRHSLRLLNHFNIRKPLSSYHEHNKREKGRELVEKILAGEDIALVTDAGMPGISDPGQDLIRLAIDEGVEVLVLPGATASITGLILSGLDSSKFIFEGFLSSKRKDRKKELEKIKNNPYTSILYESPFRIKDTLRDILDILGDREISLSRELTKKYEETLRGRVSEVLAQLEAREEIRGEFVLIIEAGQEEEVEEEVDILGALGQLIGEGYSKSQAVKKVSQDTGIPKNTVYKFSLKI